MNKSNELLQARADLVLQAKKALEKGEKNECIRLLERVVDIGVKYFYL